MKALLEFTIDESGNSVIDINYNSLSSDIEHLLMKAFLDKAKNGIYLSEHSGYIDGDVSVSKYRIRIN